MNRVRIGLVVGLMLLGQGRWGAAADVVLAEGGQARGAIFVAAETMAPDDPAVRKHEGEREQETQRRRLRESVRDLSQILERISGAPFEIVTAPPGADDQRISLLIGSLARQKFGEPGRSAPFKQGFRYVVTPQAIGLYGESDLATSYAIYELLDRLGCRWYMPGVMGEVLPRLPRLVLPTVDEKLAPGTIYRGLWYADDAYRRRNRLGGLLLNAGHALEFHVSKDDKAAHPEWIAEVDGKPNPARLKWHIPAVAEHIAAKISANIEQNGSYSVSLSPDDGLGYDNSPAELALDSGDFDPTFQGISITDRLMVICNRVAERVHAKHPDVIFGLLAYANYTRPPTREKVHPAIVPQIAPITYSRAHPMTDDRVPGNPELRALIDGWSQASKMSSTYFYGWFLAEPAAPNPMIRKWSIDVPIVLAKGCQFWQPETLANFETSMHGLYLGIRLAWNPQLKPEAIIAELHERFYGAAAREMADYWHYIDDVWVDTPEYSGCGFGYMRRWTPEHMAEARRRLDRALAACVTPEEIARVRLADESLELFERFMKMRHELADGTWNDLKLDGDGWLAQVNHLGKKYEQNYTFTRANYRPTTVNGSYFRQFYHQTYEDAARLAKETVLLTRPPLTSFRYQADPELKGTSAGWQQPDFDDESWKSTDVCRETWSTLGLHDYFKSLWYRTRVTVPALRPGKKVHLWLGATDGSAQVFVNGKAIPYVNPKDGQTQPEFNGYCQPASFDITEAVQSSKPATIAILTTRTFFNELGTGGLLAPVVLYAEK